jgi:hypothetical protein
MPEAFNCRIRNCLQEQGQNGTDQNIKDFVQACTLPSE